MQTTPTVSIVTSVHNGEIYLEESIDSILQQTYTNFEFIIIDDGSYDKTPEILNSYVKDNRIRIFKNPQKLGLSKSFNLGVKKSSGEYIARHDADDISIKNRLFVQKHYLDLHQDVAIVSSSNIYINQLGEVISVANREANPTITRWRLFFSNPIIHSSTMFRKSIVISCGGYDENLKHSEDYDLWCRIAEQYPIAQLPDVLVKFRKHQKSFTQQNSLSANHNSVLISQKYISKYLNKEIDIDKIRIIRSKYEKIPSHNDLIQAINLISELTAIFIKNERPTFASSRKIYRLASNLMLRIINEHKTSVFNKTRIIIKAIITKYTFIKLLKLGRS